MKYREIQFDEDGFLKKPLPNLHPFKVTARGVRLGGEQFVRLYVLPGTLDDLEKTEGCRFQEDETHADYLISDQTPINDGQSYSALLSELAKFDGESRTMFFVWLEATIAAGGSYAFQASAATLKFGFNPRENGWPWFPWQGDWKNEGKGFAMLAYTLRVMRKQDDENTASVVVRQCVRENLATLAPIVHVANESTTDEITHTIRRYDNGNNGNPPETPELMSKTVPSIGRKSIAGQWIKRRLLFVPKRTVQEFDNFAFDEG